MRFGKCVECKDYLHLPEKGMCRSCLEQKDDKGCWEIVFAYATVRPKTLQRGLSKKEAEQKSEDMKYVYPRKC
jgi:hypothetical protein